MPQNKGRTNRVKFKLKRGCCNNYYGDDNRMAVQPVADEEERGSETVKMIK